MWPPGLPAGETIQAWPELPNCHQPSYSYPVGATQAAGPADPPRKTSKPGDPSSRFRHRPSSSTLSVLPPVPAGETIQACPDRPSRSYPVGVIAGPTSRVSHPSLAARAADFNTDYPSQLSAGPAGRGDHPSLALAAELPPTYHTHILWCNSGCPSRDRCLAG